MKLILFRLFVTAAAGVAGYVVAWVLGLVTGLNRDPAHLATLARRVPLPHHVPEHPGGLSFRFAMAHDVIHERYPRHGPAFYRERDRLTRERLAALAPDDPACFPLLDDLAAGLERLGRPGEAVAVMRDKLARQHAKWVSGRDLYTTHANLGTFLIHDSFPGLTAGDPAARARFEEGLAFVRRSVEVNPSAHFGRERWQVAVAEFIMAADADPTLWAKFDCVGNRLDTPAEDILKRGPARPWTNGFAGEASVLGRRFSEAGESPDDAALWEQLRHYRQWIAEVGAERGWDEVPVPSHRGHVWFDEPTLGIIGMWRQGGGANPHFALALGEIMLRVGQRYTAWAAFERAGRMADRFRPDPAVRDAFRAHCRRRQAEIEATFAADKPADGPVTAAELRAAFDAELALGQEYQRAYQQYEADRIAAGASIADEHFFDDFHAAKGHPESPTGPEEWLMTVPMNARIGYALGRATAWGLLGAGLAAVTAALFARWRWPR